jgi:hypothetical protein
MTATTPNTVVVYRSLNTTIPEYTPLRREDFYWSSRPPPEKGESHCDAITITSEMVLDGNFVPSRKSLNVALCENKRLYDILEQIQGGSVDAVLYADTQNIFYRRLYKVVFLLSGMMIMLGVAWFLTRDE